MRTSTRLLRSFTALAIFGLVVLMSGPRASAQQERVLHNFVANLKDGDVPYAGVIFDKAGNMYGTTELGGTYNLGTVFEMSPKGSSWTETVLHTFRNDGIDGWNPNTSLVLDASGNLYGTTIGGGANTAGTAYELSPGADGKWTETILYSFDTSGNGYAPGASMTFDANGNLYGTASGGNGTGSCGVGGCGVVFELLPPQAGGGSWTETLLHEFSYNGVDGYGPTSGALVFDSKGNLYGVTVYGGEYNQGTVYELSPQAGGGWSESILHNFAFNGTDGYYPGGGVIFDSVGNLYGTTYEGGDTGAGGYGTVYELSPASSGTWTEKILLNINSGVGNPVYPSFSLTFSSDSDLYGVSSTGGNGYGEVFELKPAKNGSWNETDLHSFVNSHGVDGTVPRGVVTFGPNGYLYGTTTGGGKFGGGTVYEIIP